MREIKRRTHVVGIFPNESSCDRLVGAHFLERDETWQCERMRYLVMDYRIKRRDRARRNDNTSTVHPLLRRRG